MPRPRKPPRLYLRAGRAGDRMPAWVILDGAREAGTGCRADDAAGAERALQAYLARKHEPPAGERRSHHILVAEVLTAYGREHGPTVARPDLLAAAIEPLLAWWGTRPVAAVKGQACRDYAAWRRTWTSPVWAARDAARKAAGKPPMAKPPAGPATARRDIATLQAALNHYAREHGLDVTPLVTLPPAVPPRDRWLTRGEAARLLWARRHDPEARHVRRFILIGLYQGSRSQSILRLSWLPSLDGGHVDLEAGVIHRRARASRETKKRQPPVRVKDRLLPFLRRWRAADMAVGVAHVIHWQGARLAKLRRSWAAQRTAAGLGADVIPHTLRHTTATWLMQSGVDIYEAAGFLGMTPETLWRVYGHHHPDWQQDAATAHNSPRQRAARSARGGR